MTLDEPAAEPVRATELVALALSIALVPLNSTMLATALPGIAHEVHVDAPLVTQWLVTAYLLVGIALQSPAGKLADAIGHARALTLGQVVFAAGAVVGGFGHGLWMLVVSRALMAAGGAVMTPAVMAMLRVRLPIDRRARAFGAFGAVMGLAAALGPLVGGELTARFGWRTLFLVNAPPILIAALSSRRGGGAPAPPVASFRLDVVGSLLLAGGLGILVIGSRSPTLVVPLSAAGIAALFAFVAWERRHPDPVVDLKLFARPVFVSSVVIVALQNLAMYAVLFALPIVLTRAFGSSSKEVGRTLAAMTLAMVVASIASGRFVDRYGARRTAGVGAATALFGMILVATVPLASAKDLMLPLTLLGLGLGATTAPSQSSGLDAVGRDQSGMAAGVVSTGRYLGGVVGVAVLGPLLATGDPLARYRMAAKIFAVALAAAFIATTRLPDRVPVRA